MVTMINFMLHLLYHDFYERKEKKRRKENPMKFFLKLRFISVVQRRCSPQNLLGGSQKLKALNSGNIPKSNVTVRPRLPRGGPASTHGQVRGALSGLPNSCSAILRL